MGALSPRGVRWFLSVWYRGRPVTDERAQPNRFGGAEGTTTTTTPGPLTLAMADARPKPPLLTLGTQTELQGWHTHTNKKKRRGAGPPRNTYACLSLGLRNPPHGRYGANGSLTH